MEVRFFKFFLCVCRSDYDHPSAVSRHDVSGTVRGDKVRQIDSWADFEQDSKIQNLISPSSYK